MNLEKIIRDNYTFVDAETILACLNKFNLKHVIDREIGENYEDLSSDLSEAEEQRDEFESDLEDAREENRELELKIETLQSELQLIKSGQ
mgnify:CR=1 FL=1